MSNLDSNALLPCPFCQSPMRVGPHTAFHAENRTCFLSGHEIDETEYVAWNTRTTAALPSDGLAGRLLWWARELSYGAYTIDEDGTIELEKHLRAAAALLAREGWRLNYVRAQGGTIQEMREAVWQTELPKRGDTILIWVNEGDLTFLEIEGKALPAAPIPTTGKESK